MALNRLSTSAPRGLIPEELEPSVVDEVELELGLRVLCKVVSAVCAAEMLPLESAEDTLERNWPKGLLESALAGVSFCNWARYFSASLVSPDLIDDMRPERAVSKGFLLLLEVAEVDDVDEEASSENSELETCELEISMMVFTFQFALDARLSLCGRTQRYKCRLANCTKRVQFTGAAKGMVLFWDLTGKVFRFGTVLSSMEQPPVGWPVWLLWRCRSIPGDRILEAVSI
jgi:hypothetical protein